MPTLFFSVLYQEQRIVSSYVTDLSIFPSFLRQFAPVEKKADNCPVLDNPLEDENLKVIYDKWIKSGMHLSSMAFHLTVHTYLEVIHNSSVKEHFDMPELLTNLYMAGIQFSAGGYIPRRRAEPVRILCE